MSKSVEHIALLPSQRAVRFRETSTPIMMKASERAAQAIGLDGESVAKQTAKINPIKLMNGSQTHAAILRLVAITPKKVQLVMKPRPLTQEEAAAAKTAFERGETPSIATAKEEVDVDATLEPLKPRPGQPENPAWRFLTEEQLANEADPFALFSPDVLKAPRDWNAFTELMSLADGGSTGANPFAGKLLAISAG